MSRPKRQKRKEVGATSEEVAKLLQSQLHYDPALSEELVRKVAKDVAGMKYITPYLVAEKHGIPISTARRVLKLLEAEGLVKLLSPGRRTPIYVPAKAK